jgi:hypothetical protein
LHIDRKRVQNPEVFNLNIVSMNPEDWFWDSVRHDAIEARRGNLLFRLNVYMQFQSPAMPDKTKPKTWT